MAWDLLRSLGLYATQNGSSVETFQDNRTDVSGQPIIPIFKGQGDLGCLILQHGTDRLILTCRCGTAILRCLKSQKKAYLIKE